MSSLKRKLIKAVKSVSPKRETAELHAMIVNKLEDVAIPDDDYVHGYCYLELFTRKFEETKNTRATKNELLQELCNRHQEPQAQKLIDAEWNKIINHYSPADPSRVTHKSNR